MNTTKRRKKKQTEADPMQDWGYLARSLTLILPLAFKKKRLDHKTLPGAIEYRFRKFNGLVLDKFDETFKPHHKRRLQIEDTYWIVKSVLESAGKTRIRGDGQIKKLFQEIERFRLGISEPHAPTPQDRETLKKVMYFFNLLGNYENRLPREF